MSKETQLTWDDIEKSFKGRLESGPGETDAEKLDYFKKKLLAHLDGLQAAEDKRVIPFPRNGQDTAEREPTEG